MKAARARICRMIREGFGVDDIHVLTGLSYLQIWGALTQSQVISKRLAPWAKLAEHRALAERERAA